MFLPIRHFTGIDRRLPRGAGHPERLWDGENVAVLPGGRLRRRPPLQFWQHCNPVIKGLARIGGKFHGWHDQGTEPAADTYPGSDDFVLHEAPIAGRELEDVPFAVSLNGEVFAVTRYVDGTVRYWYDEALVDSESRPDSPLVAVASSRVFAADGEVVRFCKAGDPSDWEGVLDAGFLPTGRTAGGPGATIQALAGWRGLLAVFYPAQVQIWRVGLDPVAEHRLLDVVEGVGTTRPGSVAALGDMVVFRAAEGYRAIAANPSGRPVVVEVGEAIDDVVKDPDRGADASVGAAYSSGSSQYMNVRASQSADVMYWSRESGMRSWTRYAFRAPVTHPVPVGDRLYFRNESTGAILYMAEAVSQTVPYRDSVGSPNRLEQRTGTVVDVGAVFSTTGNGLAARQPEPAVDNALEGLYAIDESTGTLYRVDRRTGAKTRVGASDGLLRTTPNWGSLAFDGQTLYAVNDLANNLHRLGLVAGNIASRVGARGAVGDGDWQCLVWAEDGLYSIDDATNTLYRISHTNGTKTRIGAVGGMGDGTWRALAWDGTWLYAADDDTNTLYRVDRRSGAKTRLGPQHTDYTPRISLVATDGVGFSGRTAVTPIPPGGNPWTGSLYFTTALAWDGEAYWHLGEIDTIFDGGFGTQHWRMNRIAADGRVLTGWRIDGPRFDATIGTYFRNEAAYHRQTRQYTAMTWAGDRMVVVDNARKTLFLLRTEFRHADDYFTRIGAEGGLGTGEWNSIAWDGTHLWMVEDTTRSLYRVDLATGAKTRVGAVGAVGVTAGGLAWSEAKGALFMVSGAALYVVDREDGTAEPSDEAGGALGGEGRATLTARGEGLVTTRAGALEVVELRESERTLEGGMGAGTWLSLAFSAGDLYAIDDEGNTLYIVSRLNGSVRAVGSEGALGAGDWVTLADVRFRQTDGPSTETNESDYVTWPVPPDEADHQLLDMDDAFLRPPGANVTDTVSIEVEYVAAGSFPPRSGGWLEGNVSLYDDTWEVIGVLPGWEARDGRRTGDTVRDALDELFTVTADGGWRTKRFVAYRPYQRIRLRIGDRSGESGDRGTFCLRRVAVVATASEGYASHAALCYAGAGAQFRKKKWEGVRLEQTGRCDFRIAYRGGGGEERFVPTMGYKGIRGDTTSGPMVALGALSSEVAPEFRVEHDEFWELSAVGLQVVPFGEYA